MSFLDRLTGTNITGTPRGVQGASITPADVAKRLAAAEDDLDALRLRYAPLAFAAEEGDTAATEQLAVLNKDIRDTEDRIRSLTAAKAEADRIAEIKAQVARENLYNSQRKAVEAHMSAEQRHLAAFVEHQAKALGEWFKALDCAERVRASWPIGADWPDGSWPDVQQLQSMTAIELFRLAGQPVTGRLFPGSAPAYGLEHDPKAVRPIADVIREASRYLEDRLKAGVPK